jgi:hypothetical protein
VISKIETVLQPPSLASQSTPKSVSNPVQKKKYKPIYRQSLLKTTTLESEEDIDAYVDKLREQLKMLLRGSDGIELK